MVPRVRIRAIAVAFALVLLLSGSLGATSVAAASAAAAPQATTERGVNTPYPDGRYCPLVKDEAVLSRYVWIYEYRKYVGYYMVEIWGHYQLQVGVGGWYGIIRWTLVSGAYKDYMCQRIYAS